MRTALAEKQQTAKLTQQQARQLSGSLEQMRQLRSLMQAAHGQQAGGELASQLSSMRCASSLSSFQT